MPVRSCTPYFSAPVTAVHANETLVEVVDDSDGSDGASIAGSAEATGVTNCDIDHSPNSVRVFIACTWTSYSVPLVKLEIVYGDPVSTPEPTVAPEIESPWLARSCFV